MHSDQRQPGCAVIRAALTPPRSTISSWVLSGVRTSSALLNPFFTTPAIFISSPCFRYETFASFTLAPSGRARLHRVCPERPALQKENDRARHGAVAPSGEVAARRAAG